MILRSGSAVLSIRRSRVVFLLATSLILACFAALVCTKEVPLQEAARKVFQSLWPSHSKDHDAPTGPRHPIDDLIGKANEDFERLTSKQISNITEAANAYRQRRGRHPPPRFDEWFKFAQSKNAVIIEDLFDRIYDDLTPFWAIAPSNIRDAGASWPEVISIRNRALTVRKDKRYRIELWHDMLKRIAKYLPDVDLAFNTMDESRLFVPSESIDSYVAEALKRREASQLRSDSLARDVILDYPLLPPYTRPFHATHFGGDTPIWSLTQHACSAATPARNADIIADFTPYPNFSVPSPSQAYHGFVANWTTAKSACHNPHLRGLHGTFIEPVSLSASTEYWSQHRATGRTRSASPEALTGTYGTANRTELSGGASQVEAGIEKTHGGDFKGTDLFQCATIRRSKLRCTLEAKSHISTHSPVRKIWQTHGISRFQRKDLESTVTQVTSTAGLGCHLGSKTTCRLRLRTSFASPKPTTQLPALTLIRSSPSCPR